MAKINNQAIPGGGGPDPLSPPPPSGSAHDIYDLDNEKLVDLHALTLTCLFATVSLTFKVINWRGVDRIQLLREHYI